MPESDEQIKARLAQAYDKALRLLKEWKPAVPPELLPVVAKHLPNPADVAKRRVIGLKFEVQYIEGNPRGIAQYQATWGMHIERSDEKGYITVSLRKVEELQLTDEQLVAVMLHEVIHAYIHEVDGIDPERDDEVEVDDWLRANGYERYTVLLSQL